MPKDHQCYVPFSYLHPYWLYFLICLAKILLNSCPNIILNDQRQQIRNYLIIDDWINNVSSLNNREVHHFEIVLFGSYRPFEKKMVL